MVKGSIVGKGSIVRGGPNFDPVKYVKEVSHVIINFEEKLGWIQIESAYICST